MAPPQRPRRDLRLDFFRGLALFFIFIDHTAYNVVSSFTLQSFAFCDAAEAFIFISGVAASLAYGGVLERRGPTQATARIYGRVWQIYVAHIFLFVVYMALASFVLKASPNPLLPDGDSVFLSQPSKAVAELLVLRYQPSYFVLLPIYMLLLGAFPPVLLLIRRQPFLALALSLAVYLAERAFGWTLFLYPDHHPWGFSPLAWQFLFVTGAVCGQLQSRGRRLLPESRWLYAIAAGIVVVCAVISFSHSLHYWFEALPELLPSAPWHAAIDKRDLAPLRLVNFFALAIVATALIRRDAGFLTGPLARPIVLCGQNSLPIYCLSVLLSTLGCYVLQDITDRLRVQLVVSVAGVAAMMAVAALITWYKQMGRADTKAPAALAAE